MMISSKKSKKQYLVFLSASLFFFFIISSFSGNNNLIPPKTNDTIIVLDSVWQNDTLYIYETLHITVNTYDTVKNDAIDTINEAVTEINSEIDLDLPERGFIHPTSISSAKYKTPLERILSFPTYTFGYDFSPMIFSNQTFFINENEEYKDLYINSLTERYVFSAGSFAELSRNNYLIESGFYFTRFFENFKFSESYETVTINNFYNYYDIINWNVDTIYFLNIDSLLLGDTVWIQYFDSTFTITQDSNFVTNYNVAKYNSNYNNKNLYTYFEIPIIFGYKFNYQNFNFSLKAGIITSFFISTQGFHISYKDKYIVSKNTNGDFAKVFYSSYLSSKIVYNLTPYFGFYVEPFYRFPLSVNRKNNLITNKLYAYGIKFGLQFSL